MRIEELKTPCYVIDEKQQGANIDKSLLAKAKIMSNGVTNTNNIENNTLHEYLTINSFKEVTGFMKEITYEERQD